MHENHGISAEWAGGRRKTVVADYLAAAGFTYIAVHSLGCFAAPLRSIRSLPAQIVMIHIGKVRVQRFENVHIVFRIAIWTLHLLKLAAELQRTAAGRTFVFLYTCQLIYLLNILMPSVDSAKLKRH